MDYRKINWDDLPHNNKIGHGVEGLILKLNDTECIKIYSPYRTSFAEKEFKNYNILRKEEFLVPKPKELVEIYIGKGKEVKLPAKCEIMGILLCPFNDIESVPAIIKEFFPGVPYGKKKPTIKEIKGLLKYLIQLDSKGFTFSDWNITDFISSDKGTALVDCSTLLINNEKFAEENPRGIKEFQSMSEMYTEGIINNFVSELEYNCFSSNIRLKYKIARWLAFKD